MSVSKTAGTEIVCVEANIGAGKSTVLEKLSKRYKDDDGVTILLEPVDEWLKGGFLKMASECASKRAAFQHAVLVSITTRLVAALQTRPRMILMERSPWSNLHVFAQANLKGEDLNLYKYTFRNMIGLLPAGVSFHFILLDLEVPLLEERIKARGRNVEKMLTTDYLQKLNKLHKDWFEKIQWYGKQWHLDASVSPEDVFESVYSITERVSRPPATEVC